MAEMSFMDPETGVNVVHGAELAALDPGDRRARRQALLTEWELSTLPMAPPPVTSSTRSSIPPTPAT
jgi:hypothetical protein